MLILSSCLLAAVCMYQPFLYCIVQQPNDTRIHHALLPFVNNRLLVYRDLKPQNIMVNEYLEVDENGNSFMKEEFMMIDLGLARVRTALPTITTSQACLVKVTAA